MLYSIFFLKKVHIIGLPVLDIAFLPYDYLVFILFLGPFLGLIGSFIAIGRFFEL
jgi:hypothetical protein